MQLFYDHNITLGFCTLDAEESHHAVRVLRMRVGDDIFVTDGRGSIFRCRIVSPDEHGCVVEAMECQDPKSPSRPKIILAVAPTKNPSRMEWLVEKAVEVGVDEIVLLSCDHSERSFLKTDRLVKLAASAMKQSLHATLPVITATVPLSDWIKATLQQETKSIRLQKQQTTQYFIAHCESARRTSLIETLQRGRDTVILIGPEGDFSENEIQLALNNGFVPVSLGDARLRTETAALYAVVAANFINS